MPNTRPKNHYFNQRCPNLDCNLYYECFLSTSNAISHKALNVLISRCCFNENDKTNESKFTAQVKKTYFATLKVPSAGVSGLSVYASCTTCDVISRWRCKTLLTISQCSRERVGIHSYINKIVSYMSVSQSVSQSINQSAINQSVKMFWR